MFMVEVAGMRALYTGDYSRAADRHLSAADLPEATPHIGASQASCTNFDACATLSSTGQVWGKALHIIHEALSALSLDWM